MSCSVLDCSCNPDSWFWRTSLLDLTFKSFITWNLQKNYGIQAVVSYWSSSTDGYSVEPGEFYMMNGFYIWYNFILREKYTNMQYFCQKECKRLSCTLLFKARSSACFGSTYTKQGPQTSSPVWSRSLLVMYNLRHYPDLLIRICILTRFLRQFVWKVKSEKHRTIPTLRSKMIAWQVEKKEAVWDNGNYPEIGTRSCTFHVIYQVRPWKNHLTILSLAFWSFQWE